MGANYIRDTIMDASSFWLICSRSALFPNEKMKKEEEDDMI